MPLIKLRIGTKITLGIVSIMILYLTTLLVVYLTLNVLTAAIEKVNHEEISSAQIQKLTAEHLAAVKHEVEQTSDKLKQRTILLILFTIVVSCGFGYLLIIGIMRPVQQLVAGAEAIGAGNLKYRVPPILTGDEFDDLGRKFNYMVQQLENTTVSLDQLEASESALRDSRARYERAVYGTNDGLFDWDLQTNRVYFSPRWKFMLGYADDEIGDDPETFYRHVHPEDVEQLRESITTHIDQPGQYFVSEHRMQHKDGSYRWVQCRALAIDESGTGKATRLTGSQTDIHMRKIAELQLVFETLHDMLTRLPNRNLLLDRLQHSLELAKRHRSGTCGLLFLDLDGFKLVNDSLGHLVGDQMLIACGQRLAGALRATDTLARFGGDEFAILVENVKDGNEVVVIAQRIHQDMQQPFKIGGGDLFVGASIGITLSTLNYNLAEDMLRDADIAMYRAKVAGKGQHVLFDVSMREGVTKRLKLETQLRQAVERQEFVIHYQPIVNLKIGKLSGFEALLRWNHPELGLVQPNDFIPLLEESGLIVPVGEWLLIAACTALRSWHREGFTPSISVNISAVQLRKSGLVSVVSRALAASGLAACHLTLEVTESNIMQNEELAHDMLTEVKQLGVKLAVDDFGTGFSSLSYLKRFPWDYIKIDRSFVRDIVIDPEDAAIINAIIVMAHSLNIEVIAEGVENAEQLNFLVGHAVNSAQGYFLARPTSRDRSDDSGG